jgi:tight adherence protein B
MDTASLTFVVALTVALAIAGLGYAFLGRKIDTHDRASKRLDSLARPGVERKSRKPAADPATQRKRAVQDTLKELEQKQKKRSRLSLRARLEGAGLKSTPRAFYIASLVAGVVLGLIVYVMSKNPAVAGLGFFAGALGLPRWFLNFLRTRRQKAFSRDFANGLEVIVRGVKAGLPVSECLKIIATESPPPLGPEFMEVVEGQKMGIPLDQSLQRLYERMPIPEVNFFVIVLAIQQKTGGNLSEALGNLARVLRDRKKLRMKIQAMSSEAKASAMIIGALPVLVMGAMELARPDYISILFRERIGNVLLIGCGLWMLTGVLIMKKMINFKI